jgi:hypothetical protein
MQEVPKYKRHAALHHVGAAPVLSFRTRMPELIAEEPAVSPRMEAQETLEQYKEIYDRLIGVFQVCAYVCAHVHHLSCNGFDFNHIQELDTGIKSPGTWYQSGFLFLINVGSDFHCLLIFSLLF